MLRASATVLTTVSGAALVAYLLRRRRRASPGLTAAQIAQFGAEGYLVLRGVASQEQVAMMLEQGMAAWAQEKGTFDPEKSWLQNSLLLNIHHFCSSIRDYYFDGPLVDMAVQLIGPNVKGVTSQLTFKLKGNTMPFGWHQDNGCIPHRGARTSIRRRSATSATRAVAPSPPLL